jgi:hypothetical protein
MVVAGKLELALSLSSTSYISPRFSWPHSTHFYAQNISHRPPFPASEAAAAAAAGNCLNLPRASGLLYYRMNRRHLYLAAVEDIGAKKKRAPRDNRTGVTDERNEKYNIILTTIIALGGFLIPAQIQNRTKSAVLSTSGKSAVE